MNGYAGKLGRFWNRCAPPFNPLGAGSLPLTFDDGLLCCLDMMRERLVIVAAGAAGIGVDDYL